MGTPSLTAPNPFFSEIRGDFFLDPRELTSTVQRKNLSRLTAEERSKLTDSYNTMATNRQKEIDELLRQFKQQNITDPQVLHDTLKNAGLIDANGTAAFHFSQQLGQASVGGVNLKELLEGAIKEGTESSQFTELKSFLTNSNNLNALFGTEHSQFKQLLTTAAQGTDRELLDTLKLLNRFNTNPEELIKRVTNLGNLDLAANRRLVATLNKMQAVDDTGFTPIGFATRLIKRFTGFDLRTSLNWQSGVSTTEIFTMAANNRELLTNAVQQGGREGIQEAATQVFKNTASLVKDEAVTMGANFLGLGKFLTRGNAFAKIGGLFAGLAVAARVPGAGKALEFLTGEKDMAQNIQAATNIFNPGGMLNGIAGLGGNLFDIGGSTLTTIGLMAAGAALLPVSAPAWAIAIGAGLIGGKVWETAKGMFTGNNTQVASNPQAPGQPAPTMALDQAMNHIQNDNPEIASQLRSLGLNNAAA